MSLKALFARLAAITVFGGLLWIACGPPITEAELFLRNLNPNASPGETIGLEAEAKNPDGTPGKGVVEFIAPAGMFEDGSRTSSVLLENGKATIHYACDPAVDAKCHGKIAVLAKWQSVPANIYVILDNEVVGGGGGGGSGGGSGGDSGLPDANYSFPTCDNGFNPDHMYFMGGVNDGTIEWEMAKDLDAPFNVLCGGWQSQGLVLSIRPVSTDIIYADDGEDRPVPKTHVDDVAKYVKEEGRWRYQAGQENNDTPLWNVDQTCGFGSPLTTWKVGGMRPTPEGDHVYFACSGNWFRDNVPATNLTSNDTWVWPGYGGSLLVFGSPNRVIDGAGNSFPFATPAAQGHWESYTVRATADGFLALYSPDNGDLNFEQVDQYAIALDGGTTNMGTYQQVVGVEQIPRNGGALGLGKNGDLYATGYSFDGGDGRIVKYHLGAPPEVLYRDADQPANDWTVRPPDLHLKVKSAVPLGRPFFSGP